MAANNVKSEMTSERIAADLFSFFAGQCVGSCLKKNLEEGAWLIEDASDLAQ
jgi:hypothetical protein